MSNKNSYTIAFTGNPNCGKSTLFNALTGAKQTIGNWPGVTVELVEGQYNYDGKTCNVVDLPGIYSLSPNSEDEKVSRDFILSKKADIVINIVDASNLARNLFLTAQLVEMRVPVIVVLNMMDLAKNNGFSIDIDHLSAHLKCPVIGVSAVDNEDSTKLKKFIAEKVQKPQYPELALQYPNEIEDLVDNWQIKLKEEAKKLDFDP
ncbi:MAG: FeoB small GTPase domain-containing protein, partial [Spirochaetales bacterium]|nr:FeoB small GTPase domain-containing protein [Spirochaetales bacterium]